MDNLPDLPPPPIPPPIPPRSLQRKPTATRKIVKEPEPILVPEFTPASKSTSEPESIIEPESRPDQNSSTQRKSAPERLQNPTQGIIPNQDIQDNHPQSVEEELARYILGIQADHETEIGFLQRDLHREKTKRIHLIEEHTRETDRLKAEVQDLTVQLEAAKASIPGTAENRCASLEKLIHEFPQIKTTELALLVCETYTTIDLLNLLNPLGSSSESATKSNYGSDSKIWSSVFLVYVEVLHSIYSETYPGLLSAVLRFHREILRLADGYSWRDQVLPLAIFHHEMARNNGVTKAENWEIPETTRKRFCPDPVEDVVSEEERNFEKGKEKMKTKKINKRLEKPKERDIMRGHTSLWGRMARYNKILGSLTCGM